MSKSKSFLICLLIGLMSLAGSAGAEVTVEYLTGVTANAISADGTVIVGNTVGDYETFRWTAETGVVTLGLATVPAIGQGAGAPDVSSDGTRISASILTDDGLSMTQGRWTLGEGWEQTMPPTPPDGGLFSDAFGSAWGISGDGETVVGLYWRPGATDGSAHGSAWTRETGCIGLGSGAAGGNSRANDASGDGSVIVGWSEAAFGTWMPTVWKDGELTVLNASEYWTQATCITDDGTWIAGSAGDADADMRLATLWHDNGEGWDEISLGVLSGTFPGYGMAQPMDINADATIVVGFNQFEMNPGSAKGFIWTLEDGMVEIREYLEDNGVEIEPLLNIVSVTAVSDDGSVMTALAQELYAPFSYRTLIIRNETVSGVPVPDARMAIGANYPNPFNPMTRIPVTMDRDGFMRLEVFDAAGRRVRTLHSGQLTGGDHEFRWDGKTEQGQSAATGVYMARISDDNGTTASRRMTLLK